MTAHEHDMKYAVTEAAVSAGHMRSQVEELVNKSGLPIKDVVALILTFFKQYGDEVFVVVNAAVQLVKGGLKPADILEFVKQYGPEFIEVLQAVAALFGATVPTLSLPASLPKKESKKKDDSEEETEEKPKSHAHASDKHEKEDKSPHGTSRHPHAPHGK